AHQQADRAGDLVHRRRHGHRDHHRAGVGPQSVGWAKARLRRAHHHEFRWDWWARFALPALRHQREHHMAFKNFKVETDADGIALVTWDIPGRSMNVLDPTSIEELEAIVKQTTADAAVKGVVITSSKEAFCAGADLSMLEGMSQTYAKTLKEKG